MKISELAKLCNCTVETIRFYEIYGLLPSPPRSQSNYRIYNEEHLKTLKFILHCRSIDLALEEIQMLMDLRSEESADAIQAHALIDTHVKEIEKKIAQLQELKDELESLLLKCKHTHSGGDEGTCDLLEALHKDN